MAGLLESYAAPSPSDGRRKRIILWGLAAILIGLVLFFSFRNWREERLVDQFIKLLQEKNYQQAYALFGCTPEKPCKDYPPQKFNEDWGPSGLYADAAHARVGPVDSCGDGVVMTVTIPNVEPVGLEVERDATTINFAPWARCPGPHLHLFEFIKSRFSSQ